MTESFPCALVNLSQQHFLALSLILSSSGETAADISVLQITGQPQLSAPHSTRGVIEQQKESYGTAQEECLNGKRTVIEQQKNSDGTAQRE